MLQTFREQRVPIRQKKRRKKRKFDQLMIARLLGGVEVWESTASLSHPKQTTTSTSSLLGVVSDREIQLTLNNMLSEIVWLTLLFLFLFFFWN